MEHSVATLEAKANVCCVKFNPATKYHIAFGSAGKCLFYAYQIIQVTTYLLKITLGKTWKNL